MRTAWRLLAACALAAAAGGLVLTAAPAPVRLLGVSAQTSGRTAALLIEATDPVAYAVSRPDPLTLLVDLRNVNVGDAANQVARGGVISGVTLEQQTAIDGKSLARVRVALATPTSYRVRSARNTIRVELESSASSGRSTRARPQRSGRTAGCRAGDAHHLAMSRLRATTISNTCTRSTRARPRPSR